MERSNATVGLVAATVGVVEIGAASGNDWIIGEVLSGCWIAVGDTEGSGCEVPCDAYAMDIGVGLADTVRTLEFSVVCEWKTKIPATISSKAAETRMIDTPRFRSVSSVSRIEREGWKSGITTGAAGDSACILSS